MTICSLCQQALVVPTPLTPLPEADQHRFQTVITKSEVPYFCNNQNRAASSDTIGLPHHCSLASLTTSARECALCQIILRNVQSFITDFNQLQDDALSRYLWVERQGHGLPAEWIFKLFKRPDGEDGFSVVAISNRNWVLYMITVIGFCTESGLPGGGAIRGVKVGPDAGSAPVLELASHWISDCVKSHKCCKASQGPLPSRLLDLGNSNQSNNIRLWETRGAPVSPYVALSHCWGGNSSGHVTTTRATLSDRLSSIPVDGLPQTFRDAITVTRHLGIRFLWVDSLCICQDDIGEWARESAAMTSVYAGAHVVIAADSAPGPTHGFFQRPRHNYIPISLTVAAADGSSTAMAALAFNVELTRVTNRREWLEFKKEPLASRAWALQERLLPHRLLHFGTEQLFFECNSHFLSEDGIKIQGRWNALYPGNEPGFIQKTRMSRVSHVHRLWYLILEELTSRELTVESDRFTSIAGLAKVIKERLDANANSEESLGNSLDIKYVAGLWSDSMIEGLGWTAFERRGNGTTFPHESPLAGEEGYIAPTWSWASFTGGSAHGNTIEDWSDVATVVNWLVSVKDEQNPFGEVVNGQIRLRAPILKLSLSEQPEYDEEKLPAGWRRNMRFCTPNGDPSGCTSRLDGILGQTDEMRAWAKQKELFALFLSKTSNLEMAQREGTIAYKVLIITPVKPEGGALDGSGEFRRLGTLLANSDALRGDEEVIRDSARFLEVTLV